MEKEHINITMTSLNMVTMDELIYCQNHTHIASQDENINKLKILSEIIHFCFTEKNGRLSSFH